MVTPPMCRFADYNVLKLTEHEHYRELWRRDLAVGGCYFGNSALKKTSLLLLKRGFFFHFR